jgi:N6-adenosine-specific RNA methylase IME4
MNDLLPVLGFLFVILGIPLLLYIGVVLFASWAAKPALKARASREMEKDMRADVEWADERQRIARKLLETACPIGPPIVPIWRRSAACRPISNGHKYEGFRSPVLDWQLPNKYRKRKEATFMQKKELRARTVVADPPWMGNGAEKHYLTMRLETIKKMGEPLQEFIADDAHLWLWVTNHNLRDGLEVMAAWNFEYRSILTWTKSRMSTGHYLRGTTEHVLFGTRGKNAPVLFRGQGTWAFAPTLAHSQKPEEFQSIVRRVSPGPYLELFARRRPPTNDDYFVWGNEIDSDITIDGFPVPSDFSNEEPA